MFGLVNYNVSFFQVAQKSMMLFMLFLFRSFFHVFSSGYFVFTFLRCRGIFNTYNGAFVFIIFYIFLAEKICILVMNYNSAVTTCQMNMNIFN